MALLPQPPRGASLDELDKIETVRWFTEIWRKVNNIFTIKDEGIILTNSPTSVNFVGAGVTATTIGNDVTVTIPGGGGGGGGGGSPSPVCSVPIPAQLGLKSAQTLGKKRGRPGFPSPPLSCSAQSISRESSSSAFNLGRIAALSARISAIATPTRCPVAIRARKVSRVSPAGIFPVNCSADQPVVRISPSAIKPQSGWELVRPSSQLSLPVA